MWKILKLASALTACVMALIFFRWAELLPRKNAEWGPFTFRLACASWIALFGIVAVGFLAPDFVARNLYKLEQPLQLHFSLRTMLIVTTLVAVVLGLVCYTVR
jgi:peptidoglycan biosynthesis protein MviN/MurJ (putative lipid II flippase)